MARPPIFIIGCPRSGTTLLRLVLDAHPNISAGPETHFLVDMKRILTPPTWTRLERFGFDAAHWHARIAAFFDGFQMDYARRRGKERWCDKTPRYTAHLEFIDRLYPHAQFIHLIRDGLDVAASYRSRWGYPAALRSPFAWRDSVTRARDFGRAAAAGRYRELRYEDLVAQPEPALRALLEFLGEPWDDAVLEYDRADHDQGPGHARLTAARRREGGTGATIYPTRRGAGERELDPLLRLWFGAVAGRLRRELGYARPRPTPPRS